MTNHCILNVLHVYSRLIASVLDLHLSVTPEMDLPVFMDSLQLSE